jgi:hypothetical protein
VRVQVRKGGQCRRGRSQGANPRTTNSESPPTQPPNPECAELSCDAGDVDSDGMLGFGVWGLGFRVNLKPGVL